MTPQIKETILDALKLAEASIKRQQTAKPKFDAVWQAELKANREAVEYITTSKS